MEVLETLEAPEAAVSEVEIGDWPAGDISQLIAISCTDELIEALAADVGEVRDLFSRANLLT